MKNNITEAYKKVRVELQADLIALEKHMTSAETKMKNMEMHYRMLLELHIAWAQFIIIYKKCYPKEFNSPTINLIVENAEQLGIHSKQDLMDFIDQILFITFFNDGADKVFDLNDPLFYDDEKCQQLFDQEIFVSEKWLDQFIRCLNAKDASEDMILHNLTPEWLWPRVFRLLIELYQLTSESIKNKK